MIKRQCCKCVEAFVPSTWYIYFIIHENLVEKIKYKSSTKKTYSSSKIYTEALRSLYETFNATQKANFSQILFFKCKSYYLSLIQEEKKPSETEDWIHEASPLVDPFHATGLFLYSLKTREKQRFSDLFWWYRKRSVAWNELNWQNIYRNSRNLNAYQSLTSQLTGFYMTETLVVNVLKNLFHRK